NPAPPVTSDFLVKAWILVYRLVVESAQLLQGGFWHFLHESAAFAGGSISSYASMGKLSRWSIRSSRSGGVVGWASRLESPPSTLPNSDRELILQERLENEVTENTDENSRGDLNP